MQLPTPNDIAQMSGEDINELWEEQLRAERMAIIRNQRSTMPEADQVGNVDLSMQAAWERAAGVVDSIGRRVHTRSSGPIFMLHD